MAGRRPVDSSRVFGPRRRLARSRLNTASLQDEREQVRVELVLAGVAEGVRVAGIDLEGRIFHQLVLGVTSQRVTDNSSIFGGRQRVRHP